MSTVNPPARPDLADDPVAAAVPLTAAALRYAEAGWFVFPVERRGKRPHAMLGGEGGFKHATTNAERVKAWWAADSEANIGLWPGPSGLLVVDLDGEEGERLAQTLGLLAEPTLQVRTGKGRHLYFTAPDFPVGNVDVGTGIDIRGHAGYCILPPSIHPSGARYRWHGKMGELRACPPAFAARLRNGKGKGEAAAAELPAVIPAGERNNKLASLAGSMRRRGASPAAILAALTAENARCVPPLPEEELAQIANSIGKYAPAAPKAATARKLAFPEVEPWPEPVDGAEVLDALVAAITRYIVVPRGAPEAVALWTVFAHAHDAFAVSPNLAATSPVKRSGKTSLLTVLSALVPRPLFTSNITTAALFRAIDKFHVTLLIDEADSFLEMSEDLRGVLNSGHLRSAAWVVRCAPDSLEPQVFRTWGPKAIALIGRAPDTVEDRSIVVRMQRRAPGEVLTRLRADRLEDLQPLAQRAARWAADYLDALSDADPNVPRELNDRAADNWRPLLAIADAVGGVWPARARTAALALSGRTDEEDPSLGIVLLADLRVVFEDRGIDRIASKDAVAALVGLADHPWPESNNRGNLTEVQLAKLLKDYGIKPKKIRMDAWTTCRGYERAWFDEAFTRYLSPPPLWTRNRWNNGGVAPRMSPRAPGTTGGLFRVGTRPKTRAPPHLFRVFRVQRGGGCTRTTPGTRTRLRRRLIVAPCGSPSPARRRRPRRDARRVGRPTRRPGG